MDEVGEEMTIAELLEAVENSDMEAGAKAEIARIIEDHYGLRQP